MASTQQIKSRIGSVKSTRQITKAMELVAASKMRRAQDAAQRTSDFAQAARELLARLRQLTNVKQFELYDERLITSRLLIVVGSDRGLAGAYNSNVLKLYTGELKTDAENKIKDFTIVVGRKPASIVTRLEHPNELVGVYRDFPDNPDANDLRPIINTVVEMFVSHQIDAVDVIFTEYHSTINQLATRQRLLPAGITDVEVPEELAHADFEPSVEAVLENVTIRLVEARLLQAFLSSFASEHSMRMLAMKSATDNANELVDDLTLAFNNARQSAITQELAEITGGAEAMK